MFSLLRKLAAGVAVVAAGVTAGVSAAALIVAAAIMYPKDDDRDDYDDPEPLVTEDGTSLIIVA